MGGGWMVEGRVLTMCLDTVPHQFIHSAFLPHPPEHESSVHELHELRRSVEQESKHVARAQQSLDKVGE